jgi:hypothetical protein
MNKEQLESISVFERLSFRKEGNVTIPVFENIGVLPFNETDPIFVFDENGIEWRFGLRLSDNVKVRYSV